MSLANGDARPIPPALSGLSVSTPSAVPVWDSQDTRRTSKESVSSMEQPAYNQAFPGLSRVVNSQWFESLIGLIIVGNCVTMGIEADMQMGKVEHMKGFLNATEHVFTAAFFLEFIARVIVFGWSSFMPQVNFFNFFDAQLVLITGVLATWILPLTGADSQSLMRTLSVLRAFRLMRLVRLVRKVEIFHEVYVLLRGLTESMRTLIWTIVVIFFLTYVFAVFGVVLISVELQDLLEDEVDPGNRLELTELLSVMNGVFPMMYTLVQVLTQDSWNGIARPMQRHIQWSFVFFYLYLCIAAVVLMNLVTAIIVENALAHAKKDEDALLRNKMKAKMEELAKFRTLFNEMDIDGDGMLDWGEFELAFENPDVATKLRLLDFEKADCKEVFQLLDTGDGMLSLEEFFEGLTRMQGQAGAKDCFRILKSSESITALLSQHSNEVMEEINEMLRVMPGATTQKRFGTLKARTRKINRKELLNGSASGEQTPTSPVSPGLGVTPKRMPVASIAGNLKASVEKAGQPEISELMRRFDEVSAQMNDQVNGCHTAVASCSKKIDFVANEVAGLRTSINQLVQMVSGAREWPNTAVGSFESRSNSEQQRSTFGVLPKLLPGPPNQVLGNSTPLTACCTQADRMGPSQLP